MQLEIHMNQCNKIPVEDTTQLTKTWELQTPKDKHQEALSVNIFGPKLYTDSTLHSQC